MSDEDMICLLLMGLTPKYDIIVSVIENMESSELSYEIVKRKLKNVDEKTEGASMDKSSHVADQDGENETGVSFMCEDETAHSVVQYENQLIFYVDSGCTDHIVNTNAHFENYVKLKNPIPISVAKEGEAMYAIGIGTIHGKIFCDKGISNSCKLKNVFFVPTGRRNLLSVKKITEHGNVVTFTKGEARIYNNKKKLIGVGKETNLFELTIHVEPKNYESNVAIDELWHKRFGHISYHGLNQIKRKSLVNGMDISNDVDTSKSCEACIQGKMNRLPFGSRRRAKDVLEIIHSDVCGPITPVSINDHRYFVTFMEDYTHFCVVYMMKTKDEVLSKFKEYYNMTKAKFNRTIQKLRCDNGGEYTGKLFLWF
ncbi:hypothetical protein M8J77_010064 [Diaphorina citri]|nr:hypothetical protein M8J77_010064 [Diaphorina citri]